MKRINHVLNGCYNIIIKEHKQLSQHLIPLQINSFPTSRCVSPLTRRPWIRSPAFQYSKFLWVRSGTGSKQPYEDNCTTATLRNIGSNEESRH